MVACKDEREGHRKKRRSWQVERRQRGEGGRLERGVKEIRESTEAGERV